MPRIVYIGIFGLVSLLPFMIFGYFSRPASQQPGTPGYNSSHSSPYSRHNGFSFFYLNLGGRGWLNDSYRHRGWGSPSGRGYSSNRFQGGGPGFGK